MDVGLNSYIMTALAAQWQLNNTQLSWIGSVGAAGMMVGASVGGLLADQLGRRNVFALTLLVYGIATGMTAFSVGVGILIVLRFVVGLGLGAELPVASTLVSEFAPHRAGNLPDAHARNRHRAGRSGGPHRRDFGAPSRSAAAVPGRKPTGFRGVRRLVRDRLRQRAAAA